MCIDIRAAILNFGFVVRRLLAYKMFHRGLVPLVSFSQSSLQKKQINLCAYLKENCMFMYVDHIRQVYIYVKRVFMQLLMGLRGLNPQSNLRFCFLNQFALAYILCHRFKIRDGRKGTGCVGTTWSNYEAYAVFMTSF